MSRRHFAVWLLLLPCTAAVLMTPVSGSEHARSEPRPSGAPRSIVVTTAPELVAALSAGAGDLTIVVQPGTYPLDRAIAVPDNTALIGDGTMLYDDSGLPLGLAPATRPVILAMPGVTGDFVTLGDGASLQGLLIQDLARPGATGGAVVAVSSRHPGDAVSAQVTECEIVNPNPSGVALDGPSGRGLLAITRNPRFANAPHEQSRVSVQLTRSIIRSPAGGSGVFGINFAGGSHVDMHLRQNVIGGGLDIAGGVSRPDSVADATLVLQSSGNLYRADIGILASIGWSLQGGADAPIPGLASAATFNNRLSVHSVDDRIEGFGRAISAIGGRRNNALSGAISSNEVQLIIAGARLESTASDLLFYGARSLAANTPAGDSNELRVTMHHVTGSGPRANEYADDALPNPGRDNRLAINGSLMAFSHTNQAIVLLPQAQFFTAER